MKYSRLTSVGTAHLRINLECIVKLSDAVVKVHDQSAVRLVRGRKNQLIAFIALGGVLRVDKLRKPHIRRLGHVLVWATANSIGKASFAVFTKLRRVSVRAIVANGRVARI
jgi:hypothetical protein